MTAPRPLRIGVLAPGYPSGVPGDYRGIFIQQLSAALAARGHQICVVTSRLLKSDSARQIGPSGETIHRFRFWSEGRHLVDYKRIPPLRTATYLAAAVRLARRSFAEHHCDLIHSHFFVPMGCAGAWTARALRLPNVMSVHGSDSRMVASRAYLHPLGRWTLAHAQAVTASAYHVEQDLRTLVPDKHIFTLPMGIQDVFLNSVNDGRIAGDSPAAPCPPSIISTRTLRENPYNISTLIHAFALFAAQAGHAHARLTIVGEGPDRARYESQARATGFGEQIEFAGWSDPERLAALLRRHHIYVSTSRADGASVSLFEAMASGAYPIVTDIPANREWIATPGEFKNPAATTPPGRGQRFPAGDAPALANALAQAWNSHEERAAAAHQNQRLAHERFTWPGIAARLESIYDSLLASARS